MALYFVVWVALYVTIKLLPPLAKRSVVKARWAPIAQELLGWGVVFSFGTLFEPHLRNQYPHAIVPLMVGLSFPLLMHLFAMISDFHWISRYAVSPEDCQRRRISDYLDWKDPIPGAPMEKT